MYDIETIRKINEEAGRQMTTQNESVEEESENP
jgi:hypothetical protein